MINTKNDKRKALVRKGIALITLLMLMATMYLPALASDNDPNGVWNDYNADDVDLGSIAEKDGRLSGTIKILRFRDVNQVMKVDCPVPQEFTAEQLNAITVKFSAFDKSELLAAMEKADGIIRQDNEKPATWEKNGSYMAYVEKGAPGRLYAQYADDPLAASMPDTADEKPEEMARAKQISLSFLKELGLTPYEEGMNVARLFDSTTYGIHPKTSDWKEQQAKLIRSFKRNAAQFGYTDFDFTAVSMTNMLRGLPVSPEYAWPDGSKREPDAGVGGSSNVSLLIKDGGGIAQATVNDLPKEVSATPLAAPAASWRDALKEWMATYYADATTTVDVDYDGNEPGNTRGVFTLNASYCVLSEIKPVYVSIAKCTYTPAWCFVVEERLSKDNTLVYVTTYTLDAVTLTDPNHTAYP
jgi:hypothetical protein